MSEKSSSFDPRPVAPQCPGNDDCCHGGCDPCVFDLYAEALEKYRIALEAWEARQGSATGKPEN